jgi:hypothetical protein
MGRRWLVLLVVGCGGNNNGGGTDSGGGPPVDSSPITPPGATCGAPVMPVDTSSPANVVTSCTQAGLATALAAGGTITFSCGGGMTTIPITTTLTVRTDVDTTIDGGNQVTLDGGGAVQIMSFNHMDYRVNHTVLTLQHITLAHGRSHGTMTYAPAPAPCSQGYYDGYGGALYFRDGELVVIDTQFLANEAEQLGPDVGGGAISLLGVSRAVIANSVFQGNTGSSGGAINSLNSQLDVYDSVFDSNVATGNGANGDDASMCSVLATNGQHQTGSGGNAGAIGIDGGDDTTHTFCGVHFTNNKSGLGALGGALARTPDKAKQTTTIDRCTFDGNKGDSAAALYFHNSTLAVTATTFSNNTATKGSGAVQADGTTFQFLNLTFTNNSAMAGLGGAVSLFGGDGTIAFTTFAANHADGGDPYFGAAIGGNPTLSLVSDLFVNNSAQNPGAPMQCQVTGTGDGDLQFPRGHIVGGGNDAPCTPTTMFVDPMLGALGDNGGASQTMLPAANGPAHGAGVMCPQTDQRGMPRPATACTSGSVEN